MPMSTYATTGAVYAGLASYDAPRIVGHPNSPESLSSSSPSTPPSSNSPSAKVTATPTPSHSTSSTLSSSSNSPFYPLDHAAAVAAVASTTPAPPMLVPSTFSNSTTARVKETIARANSVPMEFYQTEFLEYSKETYERKMDAKRNKRKRSIQQDDDVKRKKTASPAVTTFATMSADSDDDDLVDADDDDMEKLAKSRGMTSAELRRQIHIQSEQRRRAQIKDGFDELRKHLPGCNNKKMSKAALLTRTVQQIQHLKTTQTELLAEVERLVQENESLKKFQHGVLQRQAMEKMYNF
ncbi:hypothetical protein BC940DRAFT_276714 [Gongronella butleri]|nr:hypothetical protein BC940DRAFT_276714 [Gongronella butleri]